MRVWSAVIVAGGLSLTGCAGTYGYPDGGFPSYGYGGSSYGYGYQGGYAPSYGYGPSYAYQPGYVLQPRGYRGYGYDRSYRSDRDRRGPDRSQHVNQGPPPQQHHAPPPAPRTPDQQTREFMGNMGFTPNR